MKTFLRDTLLPSDVAQWSEHTKQLRLLSKNSDPTAQCIALGRLGDALRRHPEFLQESIATLSTALELAHQCDQSWRPKNAMIAANLIRLATSLQYSGAHQKAIDVFEQSLQWIHTNALGEYEDFALQHMGKCFAEMGNIQRAKQCFARALEQRFIKNDDQLIESTKKAITTLTLLEQKMDQNSKA